MKLTRDISLRSRILKTTYCSLEMDPGAFVTNYELVVWHTSGHLAPPALTTASARIMENPPSTPIIAYAPIADIVIWPDTETIEQKVNIYFVIIGQITYGRADTVARRRCGSRTVASVITNYHIIGARMYSAQCECGCK